MRRKSDRSPWAADQGAAPTRALRCKSTAVAADAATRPAGTGSAACHPRGAWRECLGCPSPLGSALPCRRSLGIESPRCPRRESGAHRATPACARHRIATTPRPSSRRPRLRIRCARVRHMEHEGAHPGRTTSSCRGEWPRTAPANTQGPCSGQRNGAVTSSAWWSDAAFGPLKVCPASHLPCGHRRARNGEPCCLGRPRQRPPRARPPSRSARPSSSPRDCAAASWPAESQRRPPCGCSATPRCPSKRPQPARLGDQSVRQTHLRSSEARQWPQASWTSPNRWAPRARSAAPKADPLPWVQTTADPILSTA